jgi:hypothetical protein
MPIAAKEVMYRVTTVVPVECPICQFTTFGGSEVAFNDVCNHIITAHGLPCLHVGQESFDGNYGKPWHATVAVFGR